MLFRSPPSYFLNHVPVPLHKYLRNRSLKDECKAIESPVSVNDILPPCGKAISPVYYGLFAITKRPSISMLIAILIAIVVYLIAFVVVTGTTEAEMRRMPMGTKLVKVLRILRIYR